MRTGPLRIRKGGIWYFHTFLGRRCKFQETNRRAWEEGGNDFHSHGLAGGQQGGVQQADCSEHDVVRTAAGVDVEVSLPEPDTGRPRRQTSG